MGIFSFWDSSRDAANAPSSNPQTQSSSTQNIAQSTTQSTPQDQQACPVDHKSREAWLAAAKQNPANVGMHAGQTQPQQQHPQARTRQDANDGLSNDRIVSSIPRGYFSSSPTAAPPMPNSQLPEQSQASNPQLPPPVNPSDYAYSQSQSTKPTSSHANSETTSSLTQDGKWLYPSESQFFSALQRKNYSPAPKDMHTIIPIHNAVNERTWAAILNWERGRGGDKCGGPKLVSFSGDASKISPKAYMNGLLGYKRPFDRHDWVVERCGVRIEYVIDYYEGKSVLGPAGGKKEGAMPVSFYIDARPKLNTLEGCKMRVTSLFGL